MSVLRRVGPLGVPVIVWAFFAIDVAIGTIYSVDHLLGTPFAPVTRMFDLDGESNVPTWYSSIQWFVVFAVLFGVAERRVSLADRRSWFLWLLPLVFLAFSADEVVQLHEHIGAESDGLLFGQTRVGHSASGERHMVLRRGRAVRRGDNRIVRHDPAVPSTGPPGR